MHVELSGLFSPCGLSVFVLPMMMLFAGICFAARVKPGAPAAAKRLDKWKVIGPGGGGAQYFPTVSPHDPKRVLVRCDMTGAYISDNGGETWRMFNLRGVVHFFAFDPVDPDTIYAQTLGLWRSTDAGATWKLVHPSPSLLKEVVYADDHAHEVVVMKKGRAESIAAFAVDPANSKMLYAAINDGKCLRFAMSADWGKTWKKSETLPGALKIFVDPASPAKNRTVYVIGTNSVSVLEKGAWTHHAAVKGVSSFIDVSAGFGKGVTKPIIYAVSEAKWSGKKISGGLHVTVDGGKTWKNATTDIARQAKKAKPDVIIRGVAACLSKPEVAYIGYKNLALGTGKKLYFGSARTEDGGATWKITAKETDLGKSAPNMKDAWMSQYFGPIWGDAPRYLGVAPKNANICYTTDDGRTMRTTDGGKTWKAMYSKKVKGGWTTAGLDVLTCYGVHFDPFDRKRMFISYTDIGAFVSENGGSAWKNTILNGVPRLWINTTYWLEFDPKVKGRMWGLMTGIHDLPRPKMWRRSGVGRYNGGVCVSDDGGRTWKRSTKGMVETAPTHIIMDPKSPVDARVLYVTGYGTGVWKSVDGGKSWTLKNNGIDGKEPFAWRLAMDKSGVLYLVVARRSDDGSYGNELDGALYRSRDGAETWEKVKLPKGVNGPNGIAIDPKDPNRIYLAAWGRYNPKGDVDGGIWLSTDGGVKWKNVFAGDQHVYDVTIDKRNPKVLYATGFESSVWRSANSGATWKRVKGFNFKWGHRVVVDPYDAKMIYVATFGGSVWHGPAEGDKKAGEDIATEVVKVR